VVNYVSSSRSGQYQAPNPFYPNQPYPNLIMIPSRPVYTTTYNPSFATPPNPPRNNPPPVNQNANNPANNPPNNAQNNQGANQRRQQFDPIPMTYKELYQALFQGHLVAPIYVPEKKPPYPPWYNSNAHCDYHAGAAGHDTENCISFKRKVQSLIDSKVLQFGTNQGPNIAANPLPDHGEPRVNAIIDEKAYWVKQDVKDVKTPMSRVWKALLKVDVITRSEVQDEEAIESLCCYCKMGHDLQDYQLFLKMVQGMMDHSEIEFYEERDRCRSPSINVEQLSHNRLSMCLPLMRMRKQSTENF